MALDLTEREKEVLRLLSLGCTTDEIAKMLGLASPTVETHRANMMDKLGVRKAVLLTRLAIKHRITSVNEKLTPSEKRRRGRKRDGWS